MAEGGQPQERAQGRHAKRIAAPAEDLGCKAKPTRHAARQYGSKLSSWRRHLQAEHLPAIRLQHARLLMLKAMRSPRPTVDQQTAHRPAAGTVNVVPGSPWSSVAAAARPVAPRCGRRGLLLPRSHNRSSAMDRDQSGSPG